MWSAQNTLKCNFSAKQIALARWQSYQTSIMCLCSRNWALLSNVVHCKIVGPTEMKANIQHSEPCVSTGYGFWSFFFECHFRDSIVVSQHIFVRFSLSLSGLWCHQCVYRAYEHPRGLTNRFVNRNATSGTPARVLLQPLVVVITFVLIAELTWVFDAW